MLKINRPNIFIFLGLLASNNWCDAQYVKMANNGVALPDSAHLGTKSTDWACTYDTASKLAWEVKTVGQGLRDMNWTYSWLNSQNPAGQQGVSSGSTKCAIPGRCDTEKFITDVNSSGLCGSNQWRLPTLDELKGIVQCGTQPLAVTATNCGANVPTPTVNAQFFPNTPSPADWTWTQTPYADDPKLGAWYVDFNSGGFSIADRLNNGSVRLVQGTPPSANVARYDYNTSLLVLEAVQVGNQVFSVQLQNIGNFQFQLLPNYKLVPNAQAYPIPKFDSGTGILTIPVVTLPDASYRVQLQLANGVFSLGPVAQLYLDK